MVLQTTTARPSPSRDCSPPSLAAPAAATQVRFGSRRAIRPGSLLYRKITGSQATDEGSPICSDGGGGACLEGDVRIGYDAGLAEAEAVSCVEGDLLIEFPGASAIELPALTFVGGALTISGTGGASFAAPLLLSVGGDLAIIDNEALAALAVPALNSIGGDVRIRGAAARRFEDTVSGDRGRRARFLPIARDGVACARRARVSCFTVVVTAPRCGQGRRWRR